MKYSVAIFDMDGTILYTLEDLKNSLNYALRQNNFPERTLEEVNSFVGNGNPKLIERAIPNGAGKAAFDKVYSDFKTHYSKHCNDASKAYPGILELLVSLKEKGIKTAVVSNKDDYAVKELVDIYFDGLLGFSLGRRDGVEKKPAPDMVNLALEFFGAEKSEAVYIGDSDVDCQTAENSGLDFIGVSWGFKGREFLENLNVKNIVDTPSEIINILTE